MNPETIPACSLNVSAQTLSAWRDDLLSAAEAEQLNQHLRTCPACQQQLQDFERIAMLLRRQRELDPGAQIWHGVQTRLSRPQRRWAVRPPGRAFFSGLAAAVMLLLVVALFARVLGNWANTIGPVATSSTTPPTAPVTPASRFTVADAALAQH